MQTHFIHRNNANNSSMTALWSEETPSSQVHEPCISTGNSEGQQNKIFNGAVTPVSHLFTSSPQIWVNPNSMLCPKSQLHRNNSKTVLHLLFCIQTEMSQVLVDIWLCHMVLSCNFALHLWHPSKISVVAPTLYHLQLGQQNTSHTMQDFHFSQVIAHVGSRKAFVEGKAT